MSGHLPASYSSLPAEDMIIVSGPETHKPAEQDIIVFGTPIHEDVPQLVDRYLSNDLPGFLAHQARHGIGSYVLADFREGRLRMITGPGYCGGYVRSTSEGIIVTTLLRDVMRFSPGELHFNDFSLCYFLSSVPASTFGMLPLSTLFKGVDRLPPASVLEISGGSVTVCRTYLNIAELERPASLEEAVLEVAEKYADYYRRSGLQPAVMFSGGVDSLLILLAMQQVMDPKDIRIFTVQTMRTHSKTNGHHRAYPVAQNLGLDIELIESDSLRSGGAVSAILGRMQLDMANTRAPDLAFADHPDIGTLVLHGQNMDALVNNNMLSLQSNLELGYLSNAKVSDLTTDELHLKQLTALTRNMRFTDAYLRDAEFQRTTVRYFRKMTPNTIADPQAGTTSGIMRGMIATQYPNLLNQPQKPFSIFSQVAEMSSEATRMNGYLGQNATETGLVDLLRFYGYGQIAMKRGCSVPLSSGTRISYAPMSGPLVSYFLGRPRGLLEASQPKREVYALVTKLAGKSYSAMTAWKDVKVRDWLKTLDARQSSDLRDVLVEARRDLLDPGNSRLLGMLTSKKTRANVETVYKAATTGSDPAQETYSVFNQSIARNLLNIELLLESAEGTRV
ncbi:hypothetical protein LO749_15880 [Paracoccus denitrificans]|uniref:hypothetical protein n=1 Tax=Paracoccus denitrificans TaxID=266 RepID=UPI001E3AF026|nr:hypothetical protein [Paracoccus denitrificans]UFS67579.1 hypothetical protein LO749_15880 [Paracoccus denitrificans]